MKRQLIITLVAVAGAATMYLGCQPLPEWPALEVTGAAGTDPAAGTAGAVGAAGVSGAAGAPTSGAAGTGTTVGAAGASVSGAAGTGAAGTGAAGTGTSGAAGTGAAGTSVTGVAGTSGAAGSGAAGNNPAAELEEAKLALANLDNFTWTKPCKFSDSGKDVTVLAGCQSADVCWESADLGRTFESKSIQIAGVAGHRYQFDLRVRGVIEPRDYPVAPNCTRLPNMPADTVGASDCQDGFANKAQVTFNVMELAIPMPAKKYYFNTVRVHPPHRVDKADWKFNVTIAANQTVKYNYDDLNGGMIRNCTNSLAGADLVVKAQPYNGQWFQLNVDYATLKVLQ